MISVPTNSMSSRSLNVERKCTQRDDHFFDAQSRDLPQPIHDLGDGAGDPGGSELL